MTILEMLARLAEPWASAYSDSKLLMNGVMFGHVGGFLIAGGLAIAADRAVIRATTAGADRPQLWTARVLGSCATAP